MVPRVGKTMSVGTIGLIIYFLMALAIMFTFCRAAARGDRAMDEDKGL